MNKLRLGVLLGALATIGVVFLLAAVLSSTRTITITTTKALAPAQTAPKLSCSNGKATMNCVLQNVAPPISTAKALSKPLPAPTATATTPTNTSTTQTTGSLPFTLAATRSSIYGVDFGWSGMSATALHNIGARFAASYFSHDPSKDWTQAAVSADHRAGIATVGVWESTATRAEQGFSAGVSDAQSARTEAGAVGNTTRPIDFAVDCDCAGSSILAYFQGVHSVLGSRADAYGGYWQVLYLYQHGVVGHENWQTYAWSGGLWLPATIAPLEQYLNGNAFDNDRGIAAAYGQWPHATVKPKPRDPYRKYDKTVRHFKQGTASEHGTVSTWDRVKCSNPARRSTCKASNLHLRLLRGRLFAVAHRYHRGNVWAGGRGSRYQGIQHRLTAARGTVCTVRRCG